MDVKWCTHLEEKVNSLSADHGHTKILVNEKEIELLKVQIEENIDGSKSIKALILE